ncbi:MAG: hypothetical protein E7253_08625 [Lachnospiraceae bacterium]|nr:hypothetical protein [Lachnospiraceae bacterium]
MARKSRTQEQLMKLQPLSADPVVDDAPAKYKTAIYARLSYNNFSTTNVDVLSSQINHLKEYVETHTDMKLIDTYVDDGWSGINFNRPEFTRMMEDMKDGKINCIVVRDFSRFGRNYLESGYYLQKVFPAYNIRFISVFDHYDSLVSDADAMVVSMMQLINDFYCKDISKKICSAYDTKVSKGFCWGKAPYGYIRRNDGSGRLLMDEDVSFIVYLIFHWARQNKTPTDITNKLNRLGFLYRPSESNFTKSPKPESETPWCSSTIKCITVNPLYTGDYVYNRFRNRKYDASHIGDIPMEQWKFIQKTHPGYIAKSDYLYLQEYFDEKSQTWQRKKMENARTYDNPFNPLNTLLFCGECNHPMKTIKDSSGYVVEYHCKGHFRIQAAGHLSFSVSRESVMEQIKKQLVIQKNEASQLFDTLSSLPILSVIEHLENKKRHELTFLHTKEDEIKQRMQRSERDYQNNLLDLETYTLQIEKLEMEQAILQDEIADLYEQLRELRNCLSTENPWLSSFLSLDIQGEPLSTTLHQLINRIEVYSDNRIVIHYLDIGYKQKLIRYIHEWEYIKEKEVPHNGE